MPRAEGGKWERDEERYKEIGLRRWKVDTQPNSSIEDYTSLLLYNRLLNKRVTEDMVSKNQTIVLITGGIVPPFFPSSFFPVIHHFGTLLLPSSLLISLLKLMSLVS